MDPIEPLQSRLPGIVPIDVVVQLSPEERQRRREQLREQEAQRREREQREALASTPSVVIDAELLGGEPQADAEDAAASAEREGGAPEIDFAV